MKNLTVIVLILFVASCDKSSQNKQPNQERLQAVLPSMKDDGLCEQPPEPPELCDWVGSVDMIFTGTIMSTEAAYDEFWVRQDGQSFIDDSCPDGAVTGAAMIIKIELNEIIYGNIDSNIIEIRVGPNNLSEWRPKPVAETYGPITWPNNSNPLQNGSFIGIAATKVPDTNYLSLMGALPFTIDEDDKIILPEHGDCDRIKWPELENNITINSFKDLVSTCVEPSSNLKDARINIWNKDPVDSYATSCYAEHLTTNQ